MNKGEPKIESGFLQALKKHHWLGNTRELKNVIERAVILSEDTLLLSSLPFGFTDQGYSPLVFDLAEVERIQIQKVLQYAKGNKTETAHLLNIALATLYRKLKEYDLE